MEPEGLTNIRDVEWEREREADNKILASTKYMSIQVGNRMGKG